MGILAMRWQFGALLACLVAIAPLAPTRAADPASALPVSLTQAPPRTVGDITRVLGEYKPDPQKAAAKKALADQQPPAGAGDSALADFFFNRGVAAGEVGRITQQLEDLRQALAHAQASGRDRSPILQALANAEAQIGNFANAIRYDEERTQDDDRQGVRGRMFSAYAVLVAYNVKRG